MCPSISGLPSIGAAMLLPTGCLSLYRAVDRRLPQTAHPVSIPNSSFKNAKHVVIGL